MIGVSDNLLTLFQSFLDNRYQKVLLNGKNSYWLKQACQKGSILLFLIKINELSNNFTSNLKTFADPTSILSIVKNNLSTGEINNNLKRISEWAYQWKIIFNSDITKQAQEVTFSRKTVKLFYPQVYFIEIIEIPVELSVSQKH